MNMYDTCINGEVVSIDLDEVWRETFAHWDCLVDTDTAAAIATVVDRTLRARIEWRRERQARD